MCDMDYVFLVIKSLVFRAVGNDTSGGFSGIGEAGRTDAVPDTGEWGAGGSSV